jgi:hypothetical protein
MQFLISFFNRSGSPHTIGFNSNCSMDKSGKQCLEK